jgi:signal-transduction protein with cAMP-binding, CBS, and nucleotidyltransferase domain
MKVADFVGEASKRLVVVAPETGLRSVAERLAEPGVDLVVVAGANRKMLGVVTDSDIVDWVAKSSVGEADTTADALMSKTVYSCTASEVLGTVVAEAVGRKLKHFPILNEDNQPIGVIYVSGALIALHKEDQLSTESLLEFVHGAGYQ